MVIGRKAVLGRALLFMVIVVVARFAVAQPLVSTSFPAGQLGQWTFVGPGHLQAVLYREWDTNRVNTQATWYYFRLDNVRGVPLTIELTGLNDVYEGRASSSITARDKPFFSVDNVHWERLLSTEFDRQNATLTIRITPEADTIWIAHLEPYTDEHLNRLLMDFNGNPYLSVETAGRSVEGRDLPLWTITDPSVTESRKKVIWLMGRQHAWESHTSFLVDGLVRFLLADTPEAATLRRRLVVRLLPMMDPDGVARGGTRFNRLGYDVNRHWDEVNPDDPQVWSLMPEIAAGKRAIRDWLVAGHRIDLFLALHNTQFEWFSMAPRDDARMLALDELLRASRFSGIPGGIAPPLPSAVESALHSEFGFSAGLIELSTINPPTYGRYVTAPDRVQFGADMARALGRATCDADLNNDGSVDVLDLAVLTAQVGNLAGNADLNGDTVVNAADAAVFLTLFGKPPEPCPLHLTVRTPARTPARTPLR